LHAVFDERSSAALITTLGQATNIDANGFKINGIRPPPLLLLSSLLIPLWATIITLCCMYVLT
jgi:hypothetical protein